MYLVGDRFLDDLLRQALALGVLAEERLAVIFRVADPPLELAFGRIPPGGGADGPVHRHELRVELQDLPVEVDPVHQVRHPVQVVDALVVLDVHQERPGRVRRRQLRGEGLYIARPGREVRLCGRLELHEGVGLLGGRRLRLRRSGQVRRRNDIDHEVAAYQVVVCLLLGDVVSEVDIPSGRSWPSLVATACSQQRVQLPFAADRDVHPARDSGGNPEPEGAQRSSVPVKHHDGGPPDEGVTGRPAGLHLVEDGLKLPGGVLEARRGDHQRFAVLARGQPARYRAGIQRHGGPGAPSHRGDRRLGCGLDGVAGRRRPGSGAWSGQLAGGVHDLVVQGVLALAG